MDPWVLIVCLMTVSCCLWANVGQWVWKAYLVTVGCLGANVPEASTLTVQKQSSDRECGYGFGAV